MIQLWLVLLGVAMVLTLVLAFCQKLRTVPTMFVLVGVSVVAFRLIEHLPETAPRFFVTLALFETVFSLILAVLLTALWLARLFMAWYQNR